MRRVLVVGDLVDDIVVLPRAGTTYASDTPATIRHVPGGSAANVAAWLGSVGVPVTFVGRAGARNAAWHVAALERFGVRAAVGTDDVESTGTIVLLLDAAGERTMYVDRGANATLTRDDVPAEVWDGVGWLHLTGYSFFDDGVREVVSWLVAESQRRGVGVSVDPSSCAFLDAASASAFLSWTRGASVAVPNLDEAAALTGLADPAAAATALGRHYGAVALTLGAEGALVGTAAGVVARAAAEPARVVDTTGAGDAFAAGFLAVWAKRQDAAAALRAGTRLAARAVSVLGGRPA